MKYPQVLNIRSTDTNKDDQIAIDSLDVIRDSDQVLMSTLVATLQVDITIWDLMSGSLIGPITNKTMTYESDPEIWTIDVADFSGSLTDKHKYVAKISQYGASVMRNFKLQEFVVDNDGFEATWMTLPYQVVIGVTSKIIWYEDTTWAVPLYEAEVYQDGVGTTSATDASRVTHRGPIEAV